MHPLVALQQNYNQMDSEIITFHSAGEVENFNDTALGHEPNLVNDMRGIGNRHRHTTVWIKKKNEKDMVRIEWQ